MKVEDDMTIEIPEIIRKVLGNRAYEITEANFNKTTVAIVNPAGSAFETNIYLEFTPYDVELTFGDYHENFKNRDGSGAEKLAGILADILENRICSAALFYYEKYSIRACTVLLEPSDTAKIKAPEKLFKNLSFDEGLRTDIETNGGEIRLRFWNPELNQIRLIGKKPAPEKEPDNRIMIDSRFAAIILTYTVYDILKGKKGIPARQSVVIRNDGTIFIRSSAAGSKKIVDEKSFSTDLESVSFLFEDLQIILRNSGFSLDPPIASDGMVRMDLQIVYSIGHEESAPALLQYNGISLIALVEGFLAYAKKEHTYYNICEVSYDQFNNNLYSYYCNDDTIKAGDNVLVPVGPYNEEKTARVVSIRRLAKERLSYPPEKIKTIIRKIDYAKELRIKRILDFARNLGLKCILHIKEWNDYECWETYRDKEHKESAPSIILESQNMIRVATEEEKKQLLDQESPAFPLVFYCLNEQGKVQFVG